jgi:glycosyltransferase involved in cell wall biosynthesis
MKIIIYGKVYYPVSFSNVILHLAYYLKKRGHEVILKSTEKFKDTEDVLIDRYMSHFNDAKDILKGTLYSGQKDFDTAIYFLVDPLIHNPEKLNIKKHIFYTVWSHANYPLDWARALNKFDEVWTPSHANADAINATGQCNKKVVVVPHGYEPSVFYPVKKESNVFKIGMCNSICDFKGADVALEAFFRAFDEMDKVELWLQSTTTIRIKGDKHGLYYNDYIKAINKYPQKQLKTFYYEKDCNIKEMAQFYQSCDLMLSPHRGDGFGLVPLESLACNVPVIVSEYHGPLDYIAREYPFWLTGEMNWVNKTAGRKHFPDGGSDFEVYKYFDPNIDHLRDLMIEAYKDWMKRSKLDCKQYFKGLSWDNITNLIEGLMK